MRRQSRERLVMRHACARFACCAGEAPLMFRACISLLSRCMEVIKETLARAAGGGWKADTGEQAEQAMTMDQAGSIVFCMGSNCHAWLLIAGALSQHDCWARESWALKMCACPVGAL
jgi:hypothetical protein